MKIPNISSGTHASPSPASQETVEVRRSPSTLSVRLPAPKAAIRGSIFNVFKSAIRNPQSAILIALLAGCATHDPAPSAHTPFIVGADISSVPAAEARGTKFTDNGAQKDILQILKDHGFNYIRLRTFVEPKNPGGYSAQGYCDLPHTIEMAKRVKAAHMGLLLDFHYSDTWADPGKQTKPQAWRDLPLDQLTKAVHDYTANAITELKAAGAEPDMVQVGNEITPGLLLNRLPGGRGAQSRQVSTQPEGSTRDWPTLAALLKAGIAGVKDVDPKILIVLHIDKGGDNATTRWWVDHALTNGVQFDILGESCYTYYQGPPDKWKTNFDDLATRYPNLKFLIAEVGGETTEANAIMHNLPDHRGLGTFIWEPTMRMNGQQLFDNTGAVIPAKMTLYDEAIRTYILHP